MLISKLLRFKKTITNFAGESVVDLVSSTFKFTQRGASAGPTFVDENEVMRPDLLSDKIYGSLDNWEILLKYNGISNPFSLEEGEIIIAPSSNTLNQMVGAPRLVPEKGLEPAKNNENKVVTPTTNKDKKRVESLRTKVPEVVPPNVNLTGAQNVRVRDGKVIFGPDVTQANISQQNESINRSRVQDQLNNTNNL
ncbi:hypothetical protein UFOVP699_265 [uncultured Caudovirales phage]|uniref:Uncharacterized protein n=1 Tax=uncultured Caudovirales phage TaxID=2100421 RepID=A0A6J5NJJ3_9CAUD|nr:hypothetical protein UFOVP699_265 [uncultured Caudovirales phage]